MLHLRHIRRRCANKCGKFGRRCYKNTSRRTGSADTLNLSLTELISNRRFSGKVALGGDASVSCFCTHCKQHMTQSGDVKCRLHLSPDCMMFLLETLIFTFCRRFASPPPRNGRLLALSNANLTDGLRVDGYAVAFFAQEMDGVRL